MAHKGHDGPGKRPGLHTVCVLVCSRGGEAAPGSKGGGSPDRREQGTAAQPENRVLAQPGMGRSGGKRVSEGARWARQLELTLRRTAGMAAGTRGGATVGLCCCDGMLWHASAGRGCRGCCGWRSSWRQLGSGAGVGGVPPAPELAGEGPQERHAAHGVSRGAQPGAVGRCNQSRGFRDSQGRGLNAFPTKKSTRAPTYTNLRRTEPRRARSSLTQTNQAEHCGASVRKAAAARVAPGCETTCAASLTRAPRVAPPAELVPVAAIVAIAAVRSAQGRGRAGAQAMQRQRGHHRRCRSSVCGIMLPPLRRPRHCF